MRHTLKQPCVACPFLRTSIPGYLGEATPEQFLSTVMADHAMPCHMTVDYEQKNWEDQLEDEASYCAGALAFFKNLCKLSRDRNRPVGEKSGAVFSKPSEFLSHHKSS